MSHQLAHYFVTDIETDGPSPLANSMLSFATVVVREDGKLCGEFEAVLVPRENSVSDESTIAFWRTVPEAWRAATTNPEPPHAVMHRFVEWVESFDGLRSFAARPIAFDGIWIDHYLREFSERSLLDDPHADRNVFTAGALDIGTYIAGVFNHTHPHTADMQFPPSWLGDHEHTHRAIDDARGYASLLRRLLHVAGQQAPLSEDFTRERNLNN